MMLHARLSLAFSLSMLLITASTAKPRPIPVKVVVVAMFEVGADTGDTPGELQYWVERDHLDRVYPLPAAYHAVRMNGDGGSRGARAAAPIRSPVPGRCHGAADSGALDFCRPGGGAAGGAD